MPLVPLTCIQSLRLVEVETTVKRLESNRWMPMGFPRVIPIHIIAW